MIDTVSITKPHSFKPMDLHARSNKEKQLWRCEGCDSEILFERKKIKGLTVHDINQQIAVYYTNFGCFKREDFAT